MEKNEEATLPKILAPAGDTDCFLAALAAGADAVYVGLKQFSARMEADNFGASQLARLLTLAHEAGRKVFVAMNTLIKPNELEQAWRVTARLASQVQVDGLIIQDLAMLEIARQTAFKKGIALSTLANVGFPLGLIQGAKMGASRVILPRELSLDEMRKMGEACPETVDLECFVHGALCYCVSGRCYWSSYLGGKSGLRGRCVQPCRRNYIPETDKEKVGKRLFSCQDLEIGVIAKTLLTVPRLDYWKIEGRKKGPHYVYHTVAAYKLLRDNPGDSSAKKLAAQILSQSLGRPGVKANFLAQRPSQPMQPDKQTSSGMLIGKISFNQRGECLVHPRLDLLPGDYLRIGVEDEHWHTTLPVRKSVPKGSSLTVKPEKHKTPKAGTPVYLIDRAEPDLRRLLTEWREKLAQIPEPTLSDIKGTVKLPKRLQLPSPPNMIVERKPPRKWQPPRFHSPALWLSPDCQHLSAASISKVFFWLPPDLWPENQEQTVRLIDSLWQKGARNFVCNSPWQRIFFPAKLPAGAFLIAGPFCNTSNCLAIQSLAREGFNGVFASQELSEKDLLQLGADSPLPLGLVVEGYFPVGISRFGIAGIKERESFKSPKGEIFWTENHGGTTWIYPAWPLDLTGKRKELEKAGFSFFATLNVSPPASIGHTARPGLFNWSGQLL